MENLEAKILEAVEPLSNRITYLQQQVMNLRHELQSMKQHQRSSFFSPRSINKGRESQSQTVHTTRSPHGSQSFRQHTASSFRQSKVTPVQNAVTTVQDIQRRTLVSAKSNPNTKSNAQLKPIASTNQKQQWNGNAMAKKILVNSNTARDSKVGKTPVTTTKTQHPSKSVAQSAFKKQHHILQAKQNVPEVKILKGGVQPLVTAQKIAETGSLIVQNNAVTGPEPNVSEETQLLEEEEARKGKTSNALAEMSLSRRNLEEGLEPSTHNWDDGDMLGLVSNQSLQPALLMHNLVQNTNNWQGQNQQLSIQYEVSSFLEQSHLRVCEKLDN